MARQHLDLDYVCAGRQRPLADAEAVWGRRVGRQVAHHTEDALVGGAHALDGNGGLKRGVGNKGGRRVEGAGLCEESRHAGLGGPGPELRGRLEVLRDGGRGRRAVAIAATGGGGSGSEGACALLLLKTRGTGPEGEMGGNEDQEDRNEADHDRLERQAVEEAVVAVRREERAGRAIVAVAGGVLTLHEFVARRRLC